MDFKVDKFDNLFIIIPSATEEVSKCRWFF